MLLSGVSNDWPGMQKKWERPSPKTTFQFWQWMIVMIILMCFDWTMSAADDWWWGWKSTFLRKLMISSKWEGKWFWFLFYVERGEGHCIQPKPFGAGFRSLKRDWWKIKNSLFGVNQLAFFSLHPPSSTNRFFFFFFSHCRWGVSRGVPGLLTIFRE